MHGQEQLATESRGPESDPSTQIASRCLTDVCCPSSKRSRERSTPGACWLVGKTKLSVQGKTYLKGTGRAKKKVPEPWLLCTQVRMRICSVNK